jgi:multidrug resistance efflux pump
MQWTELESYRQLLQDYERRKAGYDRQLADYRGRQAADGADPQQLEEVKQQLDRDRAELEELYGRLRGMRTELAQARDAAALAQ